MDQAVVEALRNSNWSSLCNHVLSHASAMGRLCLPEFRDLIVKVADRFVRLPAPSTQQELNLRMSQNNSVSSIIQSLSHASSMATLTAKDRPTLYELARKLVETPIPPTEDGFLSVLSACNAFSINVHSICS
jgi:hypothetical protein